MFTYPDICLVCEECGEFFTLEEANENGICPDCKKGKLILTHTECGYSMKECKCKEKGKGVDKPSVFQPQ